MDAREEFPAPSVATIEKTVVPLASDIDPVRQADSAATTPDLPWLSLQLSDANPTLSKAEPLTTIDATVL
jgi:hypothetical protein